MGRFPDTKLHEEIPLCSRVRKAVMHAEYWCSQQLEKCHHQIVERYKLMCSQLQANTRHHLRLFINPTPSIPHQRLIVTLLANTASIVHLSLPDLVLRQLVRRQVILQDRAARQREAQVATRIDLVL